MFRDDSDIRHQLQVAHLPTMPQVLLKLIQQCQAEDIGMAALAKLIAQDPGMTGKILRVANSSAYHRSDRTIGLEKSLAALGTDMIKMLVINESVSQVFNGFSRSTNTDLRAFWHHALASGIMARDIAGKTGYPHVEEAYLAGLLHDAGRLALLATAPIEYAQHFQVRDDETLCSVEQATLKLTHAEAGAWLVEYWNLDSFLADSVRYHHEPAPRVESAHPLVRIVLLAHLLSSRESDDPTVGEAAALLQLEEKDLTSIRDEARPRVNTSATYLGIDLAGFDPMEIPSAVAQVQLALDPTQNQLAEEVRNFALVSEAGRLITRSRDETERLGSVMSAARLLFNFEETIILRINATGDALVGIPLDESRNRLSEFSIVLGRSGTVADAVRLRQPAFVCRDELPAGIVDEQLLRILGTQALVCLPLISGARCLGAMIGGIASWQLTGLRLRKYPLRAFSDQAAWALETALRADADATQQLTRVAGDYQSISRRVVHEVNNPLTIIKNYLGVLDSKLEKQKPVGKEISIIHDEIDRVGRILQGLTEQTPKMLERAIDPNRAIREVAQLFRETDSVPPSVTIVAQTHDQPLAVRCRDDALKQILINLVKNSIEAMPLGGEIRIVNNGLVNRDGHLYAELCIRDDGPGIPADRLARLFSPIPSSKGGAHQGLGLSIVKDLVNQAHGFITCRSGNEGTAFEILLPIHQPADRTQTLGLEMRSR